MAKIQKKVKKQTETIDEAKWRMVAHISNNYDGLLKELLSPNKFGFKYVYENKYLFYIPVLTREYDSCFQCGSVLNSWWTTKKIGVFKIGRKRIKIPKTYFDFFKSYRKFKGRSFKWRRFSDL